MPQRTIDQEYRTKHPGSERLFSRARNIIPSGITHDSRALFPFPIYVDRAQGSRKWDVDNNAYVDYSGGHGSLLLGHAHPSLIEAVNQQISKGSHYGASHELELRWAELIQQLVPSAERVRFTASGTESTMLALRLARAYTRKPKFIKFEGHFHGWHDTVSIGVYHPYEAPLSPGITPAMLEDTLVLPTDDITLIEQTLDNDPEIGSVIIEPSGASWGQVPLEPFFLEDLRELTAQRDVVLIFDEVITGFRWAPGGVQEARNIIPDLTALAKILAGGLPGGAVAGRADIMDGLTITGDSRHDRHERTYHPGTFNGNPLSAAAGVTMLELIADGTAQKQATTMAKKLRLGMNELAAREEHSACVYGDSSVFHVYLGPCAFRGECDRVLCLQDPTLLKSPNPVAARAFRQAMLNEGVDLLRLGGFVSAVHDDRDLEHTIAAFGAAMENLRIEGIGE
jgi:glutamate-1-semialdehyde 2,1-aminomutase